MAVIGREAARAPLTSADINDGIVTAADLASTLDLSSKTLTMPALQSLTVSAAVPSIQMTDTDNNADAYIQATDGNLRFYADDSAEAAGSLITFNIDGGEKARIDESGNVGLGNGAYIGTLSSTHSLSIQGGAGAPGGKITLYGGTGSNRIDFLIGASEAARIDSSGNLLVGKSVTTFNTTGFLYEAGAAVEVTRSGNRVMRLNRTTNDGTILEFNKDGTAVGSIGASGGDLLVGTGDTAVRFVDADDALVPFNTSGSGRDAAIDFGKSAERFKDLYLSGGVYLGGTGAANLLDDYEEGTWTPAFLNIGTGTYNVQSGIYTKVGNLVTVQCHLDINAVGTASGPLRISGFPFAPINQNLMYGVSSSVHGTGWTTARESLNILLQYAATTSLGIYFGTASTGVNQATHADIGTGNLLFSMTYRTA